MIPWFASGKFWAQTAAGRLGRRLGFGSCFSGRMVSGISNVSTGT